MNQTLYSRFYESLCEKAGEETGSSLELPENLLIWLVVAKFFYISFLDPSLIEFRPPSTVVEVETERKTFAPSRLYSEGVGKNNSLQLYKTDNSGNWIRRMRVEVPSLLASKVVFHLNFQNYIDTRMMCNRVMCMQIEGLGTAQMRTNAKLF